MILFKLIIIITAILASIINNFRKQIYLNYFYTLILAIYLIYNKYYFFSFVWIVVELLIHRMIILSNNNSNEKNFPTFRSFKSDYSKIGLSVLILVILIKNYNFLRNLDNFQTYQLMQQYELFIKYFPLLAVILFMLILVRWSKSE